MNLEEAIKWCKDHQVDISFRDGNTHHSEPYVRVHSNGWYEEFGDTLIEAIERYKFNWELKQIKQCLIEGYRGDDKQKIK